MEMGGERFNLISTFIIFVGIVFPISRSSLCVSTSCLGAGGGQESFSVSDSGMGGDRHRQRERKSCTAVAAQRYFLSLNSTCNFSSQLPSWTRIVGVLSNFRPWNYQCHQLLPMYCIALYSICVCGHGQWDVWALRAWELRSAHCLIQKGWRH